ncbi:unnamed protein product [Spirodela intermedia]|uniref:Uncharacterized protein n=1 Tax=Spirodela intermedia TaxID=51605 RepID=A0A7I8JFM1_SPIIN|nr:unnamed protein product [Spirodela intermedia]CAA6668937.1 unnamed protein product [Spirodela intermedia]
MWLLKLIAPTLFANIKFLNTGSIAFTMDVFENIMKICDTAFPFTPHFSPCKNLAICLINLDY